MLFDQIQNDIKEAMRNKSATELSTLRMLLSRVKNEQIAKQKDFTDLEIVDVISSEVKRRRDSVEAYTKGDRPELAQKEADEIAVLQKYMPVQMSEDEVRAVVTETLSGQTGADGQPIGAKDFGKAMGMVMPKLKGKAEGGTISKVLKEILK